MNRREVDRVTRRAVATLRRESPPERRAFMKGYAPTRMGILGVPVPAMRRILKGVKGELNDTGLKNPRSPAAGSKN